MASIGSRHRCASLILQQFGLAPFREILPPEVFGAAAREADCTPKRNRPLIPEVVSWLMMYVGLQTASMTQGLAQAWGLVRAVCPWLQQGCVSEEAFCQARKQLTIRFWRNLWERLGSRFEATFAPSMLWKDTFRLLAIDGSDVDLPNTPAVSRFFGKPRNGKGEGRQPQAKLVALCSVFTGFCFAFKFIAKPFTEHHALRHLIRHLRRNDLVLMDRGFFSLPRHLAHPQTRGAFPHPALRSTSRLCQASPLLECQRVARGIPSHARHPSQRSRPPRGFERPPASLPMPRFPAQLAAHLAA